MVARSYIKSILRSIKGSVSRFVAIFAIVALGVGFLAGLLSATPDMRHSVSLYYDDTHFMDLQIMSNLGLVQEDVDALWALPGVSNVRPGMSVDLLALTGLGNTIVVRTHAMDMDENAINIPVLKEGRWPEGPNECVLEHEADIMGGLQLGSTLTFTADNENLEDTLGVTDITVVGIVSSSYYLNYTQRGYTTVGNGRLGAIVHLPWDSFVTDYYTEVYLRLRDMPGDSFGQEYLDRMDAMADAVEVLSETQKYVRRDAIQDDARVELDDAKRELQEAEDEARAELADALIELEDGERELEEGRAELRDGWIEYNDGVADLAQGRRDYEREIADAELELEDGRRELEDARIELEDGWAKLLDGERELEENRPLLEDGWRELQEAMTEFNDAEQKLIDGQKELEDARIELDEGKIELEDGKRKLDEGKIELADARLQLDIGRQQLQDGRDQLSAGRAALAANEKDYQDGLAGLALMEANRDMLKDALDMLLPFTQMDATTLKIYAGYFIADPANQAYADIYAAMQGIVFAASDGEALGIMAGLYGGLESAYNDLVTLYATTKPQLDAAGPMLAEGRRQMDEGARQLDEGQADYRYGVKQWEQGVKDWEQGVLEWEEGLLEWEDGERQWQEGWQELEDGWAELEANRPDLEDGIREYIEKEREFVDGERELIDARIELEDGQAEFEDGLLELEDGERELEEAKIEAQAEFQDAEIKLRDALIELEDAEIELADGEIELADGWAEYYDGLETLEDELQDARDKIVEAEDKLRDIDNPEWYILTREENPGYISYQRDSERIGAIVRVFPIFFFLVATLVASTTMSRMVEEERGNIGTLKALGYGGGHIAAKFFFYATTASLMGSALGLAVGLRLFPSVIYNAYGMMYNLPLKVAANHGFYGTLSTAAIFVGILFATGSALAGALKENAASLMRPKSPPEGKRIFLERIGPLWRRMKFTHKVTARNLIRYKKRFFMTVVGIFGGTALLLCGFGLRDSISDIVGIQFGDIFTYTMSFTLKHDGDHVRDRRIIAVLEDKARITDYIAIHQENVRIRAGAPGNAGTRQVEVALTVTDDPEAFAGFVNLCDRVSGDLLPRLPSDGVYLSEKAANSLDLKPGDIFSVEDEDGHLLALRLAGIVENYVQGYLYMTGGYFEAVYGEPPEYTTLLAHADDATAEIRDATAEALLISPNVSGIGFAVTLRETFDEMLTTIDFIVLVLIMAAGLLTFVVMYNLTNINITERIKELATIKVLGFTQNETAGYIFRETTILGIIGALVGLIGGVFLHKFIITTVEVDNMMFGQSIQPLSYVYSFIITLAFSLAVNLFMTGKLRAINMAEALKAPE